MAVISLLVWINGSKTTPRMIEWPLLVIADTQDVATSSGRKLYFKKENVKFAKLEFFVKKLVKLMGHYFVILIDFLLSSNSKLVGTPCMYLPYALSTFDKEKESMQIITSFLFFVLYLFQVAKKNILSRVYFNLWYCFPSGEFKFFLISHPNYLSFSSHFPLTIITLMITTLQKKDT